MSKRNGQDIRKLAQENNKELNKKRVDAMKSGEIDKAPNLINKVDRQQRELKKQRQEQIHLINVNPEIQARKNERLEAKRAMMETFKDSYVYVTLKVVQ